MPTVTLSADTTGVVDSTAAWNTAIDTATATGTVAGTVLVPAGTYKTSHTETDPYTNNDGVSIRLRSYLTLTAQGGVTINCTQSGDAVLHGSGIRTVRISGFTIPLIVNSAGDCLKLVDCDDIIVTNCTGSGGYIGWQVIGCRDVTLDTCTHTNGSSSLYPGAARGFSAIDIRYTDLSSVVRTFANTNNVQFINCTATNIDGYGVVVYDNTEAVTPFTPVSQVNKVTLTNCTGTGNLFYGVLILGARNTVVAGGTFTTNGQNGVFLDQAIGASLQAVTCSTNGREGIYSNGSQRTKVYSCTTQNNGTSADNVYAGVQVAQGGRPFPSMDSEIIDLISGNTGATGQSYGIVSFASQALRTRVLGGAFAGNRTAPMLLGGTGDVYLPNQGARRLYAPTAGGTRFVPRTGSGTRVQTPSGAGGG